MTRLVFIGGAPGVGKSAVAKDSDLAVPRLRQTLAFDTVKVDTVGRTPAAIAENILRVIVA